MAHSMYRAVGKPLLDLTLAVSALILLSPLFVLISLLLRLKSGSPVLFHQTRSGYEREPFTFHKFRTMTNEKDVDGNLLPDMQRLTHLGRFLRKTSLDELPSL